MRAHVQAMLDNDRAPTASLADFVHEYERDDNIWWVVGCGHHQNLFDAACEEIDRLRERVTALLHAEEFILDTSTAPLSRTERACHKATRDAYALVLDTMKEGAR